MAQDGNNFAATQAEKDAEAGVIVHPARMPGQVVRKDAGGRFVKGGRPNPNGKPKGVSGRAKFVRMVDELVGDDRSMEHLKCALAAKMAGDPEGFIKEFLFPLLPKETLVQVEAKDRHTVRILGMSQAGDGSTVPGGDADGGEGGSDE